MKLANLFVLVGICLVFSISVRGQYFTLPGAHFYSLNSSRQVFDISPDGKIGVSLRNNDVGTHPAILTTFDPILGTQMDSESFGFGPLEVALAQVGNSLRAVVLTSEGGPRRLHLFDVSATGQLTQLGSTQLTTSNTDGGSNVVLSGVGQVGFASVASSSGGDLVAFSLNDASIVSRLPVSGGGTLLLKESTNMRRVIFRSGGVLQVVDLLNPNQLTLVGSVPLVSNGNNSGVGDDGLAISNDGRYVFLGNDFFNFAVIDLNVMQIVGTIPGNYRHRRVRLFENGQQRLLAVMSNAAHMGGGSAIQLVDATNPTNLSIVSQYNPLPSEFLDTKVDFGFSHDGGRLYAALKEKLIAFDLPTFNKAWERLVPGSALQVHQLKVYGPNDEVLGAWDVSGGLGFTGIFGAFPAFPPNISVSDSTMLTEGDSSTAVNFTISLSSPTSHRVTVTYTTTDVTAQKGSDYADTLGSVVFEPGVITRTVSVPIIDDLVDEFDETFTFTINPNLGIITRAQSTVTILDNDPPPSVSISDVNITEGNFGTRNAIFLAILSAASGKTITVSFTTVHSTTTTGDYNSASGAVTFSPGQTGSNILIQVIGDTLNEGNEAFVVNLSNPLNVTIADGQGIGTIVDDDPPLLATELSSQRAVALDSVTFLRDLFPINNPNYFGTDKRTRIMLFFTNLSLLPGLVITAQAEDSLQMVYQLPIEFVGAVEGVSSLTQIVVRLPDGIVSAGDLQINITVRDRTSNKVLVGVKP